MNGKTAAEERDRAERHPGIDFRSGPAGRRAGLANGPDIWEVCWLVRQFGNGEPAVERLVDDFSLTPDQVEIALSYAAEFPEEIEARIELHINDEAYFEWLAGGAPLRDG